MARFTRGGATITTAIVGALVLLTTLPTWVRATTPTATGDIAVSAGGTTASPATASVGLVIVAVALVLGLAGKAARVGALIVAIAGSVGAAITIVTFLANPDVVAASAAAGVTSVRAVNTPVSVTAWPYVSLGVLTVGVLTSLWLLTHLGTWSAVGRRYQPATQAPPSTPASGDRDAQARRQAMDDWDAITRGEDPT